MISFYARVLKAGTGAFYENEALFLVECGDKEGRFKIVRSMRSVTIGP